MSSAASSSSSSLASSSFTAKDGGEAGSALPARAAAPKIFPPPPPSNAVVLNVYDIVPLWANSLLLPPLRFGLYHTGVVAYGVEYSYGRCPFGTGVCGNPPRRHPQHAFRESVEVGSTDLSREEVRMLIGEMCGEWMGDEYHLLRRNCNHFSEELARRLLGEPASADGDDDGGADAGVENGSDGERDRRGGNVGGGAVPPWMNCAARTADRLLPDAAVDWIEDLDRKMQGMPPLSAAANAPATPASTRKFLEEWSRRQAEALRLQRRHAEIREQQQRWTKIYGDGSGDGNQRLRRGSWL